MRDNSKELRDLIISRGWGYYKSYYIATDDGGIYIDKANCKEIILLENYTIEDALSYIDLLG